MKGFFGAPTAVTYTADIFAILLSVDATATLVCNQIDEARSTDHIERQALRELRKGVENLKSDIMAYSVLLCAMQKDTGLSVMR